MQVSRGSAVAGARWAAQDGGRLDPGTESTLAPTTAGRSADYTRRPCGPDVDPNGPGRRRARRRRRRTPREARSSGAGAPGRRSARRPRRRAVEPVEADHAAGSGRGRNALGDDRLERRHRPRQAELVLEAETAGRVGQQVADPGHRPAPGRGHGTGRPVESRGSGRSGEAGAQLGVRDDLPGRRGRDQGRVEVRRASSSSRTPGAAPRSAGRGAIAVPGPAPRRRRRAAGAAGGRPARSGGRARRA